MPSKSDIARAKLKPLQEGERPPAVTVASVAAACLAVAAIVPYALGARPIAGTSLVAASILSALLLVAAFGMWRNRYWAVLGFQAYLALQVIVLCLALIVTSHWLAAIVIVALIGAAGALFWSLVKSLARIQMTERQS